MNSKAGSQTPVQTSWLETPVTKDKASLVITIPGYTPCNRNQMNGCHWMLVLKEKKRAGMLLLDALKSSLLSIHNAPAIGTDGTSRLCKIFCAKLASYRTMDGKLFLVGLFPKKLQRKGKKKLSSRSPLAKGPLPF